MHRVRAGGITAAEKLAMEVICPETTATVSETGVWGLWSCKQVSYVHKHGFISFVSVL